MSLDTETVRKIAVLARIKIPEPELAPLAGELNNILGWIEQLSEVDTDGVEPMTSVADMSLYQRPDEINDGDCRDKVLANAPNGKGAFYTVPKVIE